MSGCNRTGARQSHGRCWKLKSPYAPLCLLAGTSFAEQRHPSSSQLLALVQLFHLILVGVIQRAIIGGRHGERSLFWLACREPPVKALFLIRCFTFEETARLDEAIVASTACILIEAREVIGIARPAHVVADIGKRTPFLCCGAVERIGRERLVQLAQIPLTHLVSMSSNRLVELASDVRREDLPSSLLTSSASSSSM